MSSPPFISHHLFVAAVERERRHQSSSPRNQPAEESSEPQPTAMELPSGELNLDRALMSGSPLLPKT